MDDRNRHNSQDSQSLLANSSLAQLTHTYTCTYTHKHASLLMLLSSFTDLVKHLQGFLGCQKAIHEIRLGHLQLYSMFDDARV